MACVAGSAGVFAMKKASSSTIITAEIFKIIYKKKIWLNKCAKFARESQKKRKKFTVSHKLSLGF